MVNAVRAFIVDGRVAELIGEKATGKQEGEKRTLQQPFDLKAEEKKVNFSCPQGSLFS